MVILRVFILLYQPDVKFVEHFSRILIKKIESMINSAPNAIYYRHFLLLFMLFFYIPTLTLSQVIILYGLEVVLFTKHLRICDEGGLKWVPLSKDVKEKKKELRKICWERKIGFSRT